MQYALRLVFFAIASLCLAAPAPADAKRKRSQSAKVEFKRQHPCPANGATKGPSKGYIIDHVKALACGSADQAYNMQWQTIAESKAKDRWERKECGK
jgi:hypothetical protein